ncbi:LuxR C-terminal-related transcriptional regulator [Actinoplanes sp. Pm04-4]|uniref:LuxR C-terminal-related transcriptional regulator n=1 Tax=Paractinoplanes pyxinae TaxID=2997416 RepID=A0ABT4ATZ7_9ACTN|nr:LuxR C-terminal-related transcriptional regulator [Actinoplanes pyxinae]MCY1136860.1 LuxR C-terminal-related transcriptional regulator [Actinoplanes pyxinae]
MREVANNDVSVRVRAVPRPRPRLPSSLIWRPRLVDALDAGVRRTVTLVCAGAGWGKTTLIASWCGARSASGPIAWLTLDHEHDEPDVFWSDLLLALTTAGVMLPRPVPRADDSRFARWLGATLAALPSTLVVVLDDVHKVTDRRVLGGLSGLLRRAPQRVRFVLAGRREPGVSLHQLRVSGDVAEIRGADLAFRVDEAAGLLGLHDRKLPVDDLAALVRQVEGWPVGIRLAADSADGRFPERAAEDYLLEEALAGQSEDTWRFVLRTSVPDRICGPLADALTGGQDGQRTLEMLAQANLFIEPVGTRGWFRYHRTFRSALRHRLQATKSGLVPALHLVAARWHASSGDVLPALSHAAGAANWPLLAHLVMDRGMPLFNSGDRAELIEILRRIPAARLSDNADLVLCAAIRAFDRGDIAAMAARLAEARTLHGSGEGRPLTSTGVALGVMESAILVRWQGDMPRLLDLSTELLADIAALDTATGPALPQYRTMALTNKAIALLWSGQFDHADRYLWAASSGARGAGMPLIAASALGHLALLDFLRGSIHEAERNGTAALDLARRIDASTRPAAAPAHLVRALIESERGRGIEAGDALRMALHSGGEVPEAVLVVLAALVRVRLLVDRGEALGARTVLRQAWAEARPGLVAPVLMRLTDVAESEIDLALGDACAVFARYGGDRPLAPPEQACLARSYLATGRHDAAEALAGLVRTSSDRVSAVTGWVITALAADARGRSVTAGEALERALTLAEPDHIRRPFRHCDPQRLLQLAGRQQWLTELRGPAGDNLLGDITGELPVVIPSAGPLSERELEVLHYLPTMLTAGEIAENLNISINTVKAHMRSIYRKLGAGRRREAVVTARQLGLI